MSDVNYTFGFALLQELYLNQTHKKEDLIILFVHWYLTKTGFRCVGIGNEKTFNAEDKGSELLPTNWNTSPNYTLRYIILKKLYVLLAIRSDEDLLINFVRYEDESICTIQLSIEGTVPVLKGPLETVVPSYQEILRNIQKNLIDPLYSSTNEATTETMPSDERERQDEPELLRIGSGICTRPHRLLEPAGVGARDLNPFGQGGGMIFDPFHNSNRRSPRGLGGLGVPGRLPPGAIPPGARFSPFGPPEIDDHRRMHHRRPDDDHLPPPGYDDMFM